MPEVTLKFDTLHDSQRSVWQSSMRYNFLQCGRRYGKTTLLQYAAKKQLVCENGMVAYAAPTRGTALPVWEAMRQFFERVPTNDGGTVSMIKKCREDYMRLTLINGSEFHVWPLDKDLAFRGFNYDVVLIDEAAFVRNLLKLWHNSIRPTLTDRKGRAWFVTSPRGRNEAHTMYEWGQQGRPDWFSRRLGTADNPYISPDEIEAARQEIPTEAFEEEYMGIPSANAANPFGSDAIEACVGPVSNNPPVFFGVDIAQAQDWTVVIGLDQDGNVASFDRLQHVPYSVIEDRICEAVGNRKAVIDSTGVGAPEFERIAARCPRAERFVFTSNNKQELMHGLRAAIHRRDIRYPDGPIRQELDVFQYKYTPGGGVRYEAPHGFHDDCVMALGMAVHARGQKSKPVSIDVIRPVRTAPRVATFGGVR